MDWISDTIYDLLECSKERNETRPLRIGGRERKMKRFQVVVLAVSVLGVTFSSLLIPKLFAGVAPDAAVTSISGNLKWDKDFNQWINLDYWWTVKNVGSVKTFYDYYACLYPWDGGPNGSELQLPTGIWVWVAIIDFSTTRSLDPGQSAVWGSYKTVLFSSDSAYIKSRGGVYILAFIRHVVAEDGTPETNVEDDARLCLVSTEAKVGGSLAPIDRLVVLAPYIGLASTVLVATVASVIYVKRVRRRKEKQ